MDFKFELMLQKIIKSTVKALLGVVIGFIGAENLIKHGVNVDIEVLSGGLAIVIVGILEGSRNYAKNKLGWKWL